MGEIGGGDGEDGAGIEGLLLDLGGGVDRVRGGDGGTCDENAKGHHRIENGVGREEEDSVSGTETEGSERGGEGKDGAAKMVVGENIAGGGVDERRLLAGDVEKVG